MNIISNAVQKLDQFQQRRPRLSFVISVIKKFGDDKAGQQGALITYYGFLSLFPLLLVTASVIVILSRGNHHLATRAMEGISSYFPILGDQLQRNIHTPHQTGLALIAGLLFTLYGARGGADAFRNALNHIWHIPKNKQITFPLSILNSFELIFIGGIGLASTAWLSAYASGLGDYFVFKVVSVLVSLFLLFVTFYYLFRRSIKDRSVTGHDIKNAASLAAIGILILQAMGGYLVSHQLKNLTSLYGTFAVVLGLLFWIYLQVEVVLYALEISTVLKHKLWPRSILNKNE